MTNGDSEVLIYAPFKKENLSESEIKWLDAFQTILTLSLTQITKQKIKIESSFLDRDILNGNFKVFILVLINHEYNFEGFNNDVFKNKKFIQVNAYPDAKEEASDYGIKINLFNEAKNKAINLSGQIDELQNETWLKFLDIAYEIRSVVIPKKQNSKVRGNIFIAETSSEQNTNRETIIRELEHLEYKVLPNRSFPKDMISFSDMVQENMKECFLSIHIIGNFYAPLLENIDISSVELQNDLFHEVASELNSKNKILKRLVWIPPDIKPKSEKQKLYIESFKRNIELLKNTEIIQAPIEVFKTIIKEKANSLLEVKETIKQSQKDNRSVYLISNGNVNDHKIIKEYLVNQKLEVLEIKGSDNKIDLIQSHYYNLVNCDALLIDYSVENFQWLNSKLSDIIKSPGFGRKKEFIAKTILVNTEKSPEINLNIHNLELIENSKKDIKQRLASFIEKINQK